MIHKCHVQLHSAKDLGAGMENPVFMVPFDLNLMEVEAYHDEDSARDQDALDHIRQTEGTHVWMRSGNRYVIDTPFKEFRKLYRSFLRDLLTSPDISIEYGENVQENARNKATDPKTPPTP